MTVRRKKDKLPYQQRYIAAPTWITAICAVLLAAVVLGTLCLALLYRRDARRALSGAKAVRLALESVSKSTEALDERFSDPSQPGGVARGLYEETRTLAKAPGDFQLLRTGPDGFGVERFSYTEKKMTVYFDAGGGQGEDGPHVWTVKLSLTFLEADP